MVALVKNWCILLVLSCNTQPYSKGVNAVTLITLTLNSGNQCNKYASLGEFIEYSAPEGMQNEHERGAK